MTNELQAEEAVIDDQVTVEANNEEPVNVPEEGAPESATGEPEKVVFDERQQAIFNDAIGEKVKKQREAERRAEQLQKQIEDLKAAQPKVQKPAIPEMPDPFDDDFEQKLAAREEAIKEAVKFEQTQEIQRQQEQALVKQQQQAQQKVLIDKVQTYTDKAKSFGISEAELQVAGNAVAQYGIQDAVVMHVLEHDKGPLITEYLAKNPLEIEQVRMMSPMQAAIHIETQIKPKAEAARKVTNAPPPPDVLDGGAVPARERGPKGATFE